MQQNKWIKVELVNVQTLGARSGYGEGRTLQEAIKDGLERARRFDPNAKYHPENGQILFAGGVNC